MKKICCECKNEFEAADDKVIVCDKCANERLEGCKENSVVFYDFVGSSAALFGLEPPTVCMATHRVFMSALRLVAEMSPDTAVDIIRQTRVHLDMIEVYCEQRLSGISDALPEGAVMLDEEQMEKFLGKERLEMIKKEAEERIKKEKEGFNRMRRSSDN